MLHPGLPSSSSDCRLHRIHCHTLRLAGRVPITGIPYSIRQSAIGTAVVLVYLDILRRLLISFSKGSFVPRAESPSPSRSRRSSMTSSIPSENNSLVDGTQKVPLSVCLLYDVLTLSFRRRPQPLRLLPVAVTINLSPSLRHLRVFLPRRRVPPAPSSILFPLLGPWVQSQPKKSTMTYHLSCHRARTLIPGPIFLTLPLSARLLLPLQNTG